jgi:hypothetical protein
MTAYWLAYMYIVFLALIESPSHPLKDSIEKRNFNLQWIITFIFLSLFIGLRHNVGGDWGSYLIYFEEIKYTNLSSIFNLAQDFGYAYLNWFVNKLGSQIYLVNLICGIIFSYGLCVFCIHTRRPFLALAAAFPYLVIVVAMGYTRQSVAIGLGMIGFILMQRRSFLKFAAIMFIAMSFHKTSAILLGLAIFIFSRNKFFTLFGFSLISYLLFSSPFLDQFKDLYQYYVLDDYQSQGAAVRVAMLFLPSIIFLIWPHRFHFSYDQERLWKLIAYISIGLLLALLLLDASTAVDRIALYFLPIQMIVFSSLPEIIKGIKNSTSVLIILIILFYISVMFVWLNFAFHAMYWLPYSNLLFEML